MSSTVIHSEKKAPKLRFKEFKTDWHKENIGDVFDFKQGVQSAVENQVLEQRDGYVRFIRIVDLTKTDEPIRYIEDPGEEHHIKLEDLFMVRYGNPGILGYGYEGVIANNLFRILPIKNNLNTKFYFYLLGRKKKELDLIASSSTMPALNFSSLRTISLVSPNFPEQQKIASFFSAVDEKIQRLTRKKELLEQYKKGLMQQLFSGKLRFKDENGKPYPKWEEKKLDEVCEINPSSEELPESFIYIDLESVVKGELIQEKRIYKDDAPSRAQRRLLPQDILYQTVRPYQMNNYLFEKKGDYVASTGYAQIRTNQETKYIYQLLHSEDFVNEVIERCTGTSFPAINSKDLAKIKVPIPHKEEQQKIASLLTALDAKIESVAEQTAHTQTFKKGLLQQMFV
jgi:type I restriction enzyme, S subunit